MLGHDGIELFEIGLGDMEHVFTILIDFSQWYENETNQVLVNVIGR